MSSLDDVRRDLTDEQLALDDLVATLDDEGWRRATPSVGWNVADQMSHLAYFDAEAARAINDPDTFATSRAELMRAALAGTLDDYTLGVLRRTSPSELLATWRANRTSLNEAARRLDEKTRVAWYGPSMGATSFLSARLMETWAHGTDVADALGTSLPATDRLRHVARLGYITLSWSYHVRGEQPPDGQVRVELTGPTGDLWTWGADNSVDVVQGSAREFCLVVVQRRHLDDTSLVTGDLGRHWLLRAQAFAGAPSVGPEPRRQHGTN